MEVAALNADECLWKPGQHFVGSGLFGRAHHFTWAGTGAQGQSRGGFSVLASGMLDQALRGAGYLISGSRWGAQGEK